MKEIINAIARFRADCPAFVKNEKGVFADHYYATLTNVLSHIHPILGEHGLSYIHNVQPTPDGSAHVLTLTISHKSGESLVSSFYIPGFIEKNLVNKTTGEVVSTRVTITPQELGSALTYYRRYSLLTTLGLMTEDDDGAHASRRSVAKPQQQRSNYHPPAPQQQEQHYSTCPACGADAVAPSRFGDGSHCYKKAGGCGKRI